MQNLVSICFDLIQHHSRNSGLGFKRGACWSTGASQTLAGFQQARSGALKLEFHQSRKRFAIAPIYHIGCRHAKALHFINRDVNPPLPRMMSDFAHNMRQAQRLP